MRLKQKAVGFFSLLALVSVFLLLSPSKAEAISASFKFKDRGHVEVLDLSFTDADKPRLHPALRGLDINAINTLADQLEGEYTDSNIFDNGDFGDANNDSDYQKDNGGCVAILRFERNPDRVILLEPKVDSTGVIECDEMLNRNDDNQSFCSIADQVADCDYNAITSSGRNVWFNWVDEDTLTRADGRDGNFTLDTLRPGFYLREDEGNQPSENIDNLQLVTANDFTRANYHYRDGNNPNPEIVRLGNTAARSNPPNTSQVGSGTPATAAPTCESNGGNLSFLLCDLLEIADGLVTDLDTALNNVLQVPNKYFEDDPTLIGDPAEKLEATWARLRNIAYIILVPVMLVMVISTALGFDLVSAYTVKKALPRLVAAIIFIALSWQITKFLVVLTNDIGSGIGGLISSSFGGASQITLSSILQPSGINSGVAVGSFIGLAIAGAAVGSIGIILSYAFVTVLALLIGFTLLSLRQMLVIGLMLLAPMAILAWIFPGNDKLWKLWWGTFSKLLLLYPLIVILIASGKSFAMTVSELDSSIFSTFIKLVAYIGPYFFIPAAFKFAGGIFGTLSGMANDRGKGLFDRNKKYRAEKAAKNYSEFRKGDKGFRPKAFNTLGRRVDAGFKGRYGFGDKGRAAFDIRSRANAAEAQKDPLMNQLQFDDDGIMAMALSGGVTGGGDARKALYAYRQRLMDSGTTANRKEAAKWTDDRIEKAVGAASAVGFNRSNATAAVDMMARNKSFSLAGGPVGMETMLDATGRLAGGNAQAAENLMGSFEFNSRQAGRNDLGMHDYKHGTYDMNGAWGKASLGQHAQGTSVSLQAFADHHLDKLQNGNQVERRNAAIAMMELQNMLPNATAGNQDIINKTMFRMRDDAGTRLGLQFNSNTSVEDQIAQIATTTAGGGLPAVDMENNALTGRAVRGMARVYDRDSTINERTGTPAADAPDSVSGMT